MFFFILYSSLALAFYLPQKKWVHGHGIIGVGKDIIILLILPFVWYFSVGGEAVSRTYLVKTQSLVAIQFTLFILNSAAGKALYSLLFTLGVVLSNLLLLVYSWPDVVAVRTSNYVDHVLGSGMSMEYFGIVTISLLLSGLFLSYFTRRNAQVLAESIKNETKVRNFSRYFSPNILKEIHKLDQDFAISPGRNQQFT